MHELAITESLLSVAVESATAAGAERIRTIRMRVGALTGVVPDSMRFYFDAISRGTLAEGASLEMTIVPASAECADCATTFPADEGMLACPTCGCLVRLTSGTELTVESLEVDP